MLSCRMGSMARRLASWERDRRGRFSASRRRLLSVDPCLMHFVPMSAALRRRTNTARVPARVRVSDGNSGAIFFFNISPPPLLIRCCFFDSARALLAALCASDSRLAGILDTVLPRATAIASTGAAAQVVSHLILEGVCAERPFLKFITATGECRCCVNFDLEGVRLGCHGYASASSALPCRATRTSQVLPCTRTRSSGGTRIFLCDQRDPPPQRRVALALRDRWVEAMSHRNIHRGQRTDRKISDTNGCNLLFFCDGGEGQPILFY